LRCYTHTQFRPPSIFSFNDPPPPETSTLSLHDALPISAPAASEAAIPPVQQPAITVPHGTLLRVRLSETLDTKRNRPGDRFTARSEEHTSELQSRSDLVCRLLLEKKKGE